ncbi:MAG: biopolymer transporter ExbD [bacterium]
MSNKRRSQTFSEINITPLTDIFLVLLIIMMVIAPMLDKQGLKLMLPTSQESKDSKESKLITVSIDKNNKFSIDDKEISQSNLIFVLQDEAKKKKDGLIIQADSESEHGSIVNVMDTAKTAGINNISVLEK